MASNMYSHLDEITPTNIMKNKISTSTTSTYDGAYTYSALCSHPGIKYPVGDKFIRLGARIDMTPENIKSANVLISLCGDLPFHMPLNHRVEFWNLELADHGGVPADWKKHIAEIARMIRKGKDVLAYCIGGHGRTGTLYASLLALVEKPDDPITVARERYCDSIVESAAQAMGIFENIMGQTTPADYLNMVSSSFYQPYIPGNTMLFLVQFADGEYTKVWLNNAKTTHPHLDYLDKKSNKWIKFYSLADDKILMDLAEFVETYTPWGPYEHAELTQEKIDFLNYQSRNGRQFTDEEVEQVIDWGVPKYKQTLTETETK